jgi:hypothetical protein
MQIFFTGPQLQARYDRDRTTIYRWLRSGYLPPPDLILNTHPRWHAETIAAFEQRNGVTASMAPCLSASR